MTAWLSNYLGQQVLKAFLNNVDYTAPTAVYMGLGTAATSADELSGGAYTRQPITFTTITGGTLYAPSTLTAVFADIPGGSISHFQLWDDPSAGNMLYVGTIDSGGIPSPISVSPGDTLTFASGSFTIGFTGQP